MWRCRFDGDGMLHAVRIKDGKAAYSNAYVQTSKFKQEKKAGRPLFFTVGPPIVQQVSADATCLAGFSGCASPPDMAVLSWQFSPGHIAVTW